MQSQTFEQYVNNGRRLLKDGVITFNERTGQNCLTLPVVDFEFDLKNQIFPIDTTRKSFWKAAVAELLGYIRGYSNADQFAALGARTWFKDANENEAWLNNPNRKGENDIGLIYGALANHMPVLNYDDNGRLVQTGQRDILHEIYTDLKAGRDNRFEIWSFLSYPTQHLGTINPCLHTHQFTLLGDTLYLSSTQRSADYALGTNFNMVQVYVLNALMAQITQLKTDKAYLRCNNTHLYERHIETFKEQMRNPLFPAPKLWINPEIKTLEDLRTWVTLDDFRLDGYEHSEIEAKYEMFTGTKK